MKQGVVIAATVMLGCRGGAGPGAEPSGNPSGEPTGVSSAETPDHPAPLPARGTDDARPLAPSPSATNVPSSPSPEPAPGLTIASGSFLSAACESRSYPRHLELDLAKKQLSLEDRISPCPPDVACVWSGIVERQGSFTLMAPPAVGEPTRLEVTWKESGGGKGEPAPAHFEWYESRGVLTEAGDR
ncbi:MAG: hypothetical protein AAGA56_14505, partial [Myxococcota bacterium]